MSAAAVTKAAPVSASTTASGLNWARVGAVLYIVWALLHLVAAWAILEPATAGVEQGPTLGRVRQNSAFMTIVALASIWIALRFNWSNDRFGWAFNLFLIGATDAAFILLVLAPGWEPLAQGLIGPAIWVLGATASTIGYLHARRAARKGN